MEQQRALNALAPYLALTPSATSPRAASDLVTQATSAPATFVFAELLQSPSIQALHQSTDYAPHLRLLEIFAWGTWADYQAQQATLPKLTPAQHEKLLLLSLLPLLTAPRKPGGPDPLAYATLQAKLGLSSPRDLERLVHAAIYAGLLAAHLDPLHQRVAVSSVAALRDLAPASLPPMIDALADWEARCADVLADVEGQIQTVRREARERQERERRREAAFEAAVKDEDEREARKGGKRGVPGGNNGPMDLDDGGKSGGKGKGPKRNLKSVFQRL